MLYAYDYFHEAELHVHLLKSGPLRFSLMAQVSLQLSDPRIIFKNIYTVTSKVQCFYKQIYSSFCIPIFNICSLKQLAAMTNKGQKWTA